MENKIFPRLNCLVYHGEGNPCNCDMDREEPIAKTIDQFKQEVIKELRENMNNNEVRGYYDGLELAIEIIKSK